MSDAPRFRVDLLKVGEKAAPAVKAPKFPPPGRDLDVAVFREVLGVDVEQLTDGAGEVRYLVRHALPGGQLAFLELPRVSTEPGSAWRWVVPNMEARGLAVRATSRGAIVRGKATAAIAPCGDGGDLALAQAEADTIDGAICLAALATIRQL